MPDLRAMLSGDSVDLAPKLLGWTISHETDAGIVAVTLTEVEAYAGETDPASHAYRGRSPRNGVMFGPAGFLYCYFSYGMHWCANVVTGPEGEASAVLLRAGKVVEGIELARERRGKTGEPPAKFNQSSGVKAGGPSRRKVAHDPDRNLARGPANLAQALGLGREQNGADTLSGGAVSLSPGSPAGPVTSGPRVGVTLASDVPWRFWIERDPTVSAYRPSPRASI